MNTFDHLADLSERVGEPLGTSDWMVVSQSMIDRFADVTADAQWIHTEPARAAQGPFGTPIAHGFLTLSLLSALGATAWRAADARMGVNAGFDRVRMTSPVHAGSRVRAHFTLQRFEPLDGGFKLGVDVRVEIENTVKPALVALWLVHQYT